MAGTGKKGYTGVTSDGRVISGGVVQNNGTSTSSKSGPSAGSQVRVSSTTHSNGQPTHVYTSSGKAVPTYGHRVVQGGKDGNLYDINNGIVRDMNGKLAATNLNNDAVLVARPGAGQDEKGPGSVASRLVNAANTVRNVVGQFEADGGYLPDDDYEGYGGGRGGYGGYGDLESGYTSRYEGQIQNILNNILKREPFDITKDANYQMLYDLYNQRYTQNASRAMRDLMGQAASLTGGYGSSYGQTVGSQAYDNVMQGLNDNNTTLMNIAYGMYADDVANDYNQLKALTGLDDADYAKYLDAWNQLYRLNRDDIEDARYADELAYAREQNALDRELAAEELAYSRAWNEDDRDYSRSRSAFNDALSLIKAGYSPTDLQTSYLGNYPGATNLLSSLAAQAAAAKAGTSGGGSSGGRSSGGSSYNSTNITGGYDWEDVLALYQSGQKSTAQKAYNGLTKKQQSYYNSAIKAMGNTGFGKTR